MSTVLAQKTPRKHGNPHTPTKATQGTTRITAPIITWPQYKDSVPHWLKEQTIKDRFNAKDTSENLATDSEALAYIMGASLSMPLDSDWTDIYFYCFTKVMESAGKEIPAELQRKSISQDQQELLNKLQQQNKP